MGWAGCDGGELLLVLLAVRLSVVHIHTVEYSLPLYQVDSSRFEDEQCGCM